MMHTTIYHSTSIQEGEDIVEILPGGDMPKLLWELLRRVTPRHYERHIVNFLKPKFGNAHSMKVDEMGNFIVQVGKEQPTTMFSCHMDIVGNLDQAKWPPTGKCVAMRLVGKPNGSDMEKGYVWAAKENPLYNPKDEKNKNKYIGLTLGGDDKAGCYVLSEMIMHNIPGLYVFHVGEEGGCVGSRWIVEHTPDLVKGIQRCIAFDRRDYTDVIAHQRGSRTSSIKCTDAIAAQLNELIGVPEQKYRFRGDVHGAFTDSAVYDKLIPECTNISVGYFNNHGSEEYLDYFWLSKMLVPAALKVKWDELPVERDPNEKPVWQRSNVNNRWQQGDIWVEGYGWCQGGWENYGADPAEYAAANAAANGHVIGKDDDKKNDNIKPLKPSYWTSNTEPHLLPQTWEPADGLILDASKEGMISVIRKWWQNPRIQTQQVFEAMFDSMLKHKMAVTQVKVLANELKTVKDENENLKKKIQTVETLLEIRKTVEDFEKKHKKEETAIKQVLALPKPQVKIEELAFDKFGYPISEELRSIRAGTKLGLISELLDAVKGYALSNKYKQAMNAIEEHFSKLAHWSEANPANKKLYLKLNDTLSNVYNIVEMEVMPNKPSEKVISLYLATQQHFKECFCEPGINVKNIAASA